MVKIEIFKKTACFIFAGLALFSSSAQGLLLEKDGYFFGLEISELAQNKFQNLGLGNYTFFIGQKFSEEGNKGTGWEFLSINVDLSEEHLADKVSVPFIEGNRDGLVGKLSVQRIYFDRYLPAWRWKFLEIIPIVSLGLGYNYWEYENTRFNEKVIYNVPSVSFAFRNQFLFHKAFFVECPVVDLFLTPRREKQWVGDTYINAPEYFGVFAWIKIGGTMQF